MATLDGVVDGFKAMAGQWLDLQLPSSTAALEIADWGKVYSGDTFWLIAPDGRAISLAEVSQMAPHWGTSLRISALSAGSWKVVRIGSISEYRALAAGQLDALTPIADLMLESGTSKTIQIYPAPAPVGGK